MSENWKPNTQQQNTGDTAKKEEIFLARVHEIIKNKLPVLEEAGGLGYKNRFCWTVAGIVGSLTNDETEQATEIDKKKFTQILKNSKVKNVAEIGPGDDQRSMIFPLRDAFKSAGCKLSIIADDLGTFTKNNFERADINVIEKEAGKLHDEKLKLDLIVAKNVFSIGGHFTAGHLSDDPKVFIKDITHNVLDLVHQLSNNPRATIVLTEQYDLMPLDKNALAKEVNILAWEQWSGTTAHLFKDISDQDKYVEDILSSGPNFVVLQKKLSQQ